MAEGVEGRLIEEVAEKTLEKMSPFKRVFIAFKQFIVSMMLIKWLISFAVAWFDMIRQSILLSLTDKYQENKVWKAILWIKTWRLIYGIIIGLLLAFYWQFDDTFMQAVQFVIDLFN